MTIMYNVHVRYLKHSEFEKKTLFLNNNNFTSARRRIINER